MPTTYADVLGAHNITAPDDLLAEVEVPVLAGDQRQGDVGIWAEPLPVNLARTPERAIVFGAGGVPVVQGEATGNSHILDAYNDAPVYWHPVSPGGRDALTLGWLDVPEGSVATLIHTDEHGVNSMAAGTYRLTGKREMADEVRRVAD
jgi:hypothetical protein